MGDTETDCASWPVKELARFLKERGIDPTGIVEKAELVAKVKEVSIFSHRNSKKSSANSNSKIRAVRNVSVGHATSQCPTLILPTIKIVKGGEWVGGQGGG